MGRFFAMAEGKAVLIRKLHLPLPLLQKRKKQPKKKRRLTFALRSYQIS